MERIPLPLSGAKKCKPSAARRRSLSPHRQQGGAAPAYVSVSIQPTAVSLIFQSAASAVYRVKI